MSDYKTRDDLMGEVELLREVRDDLLKENKLLKAVIAAKNEIINGYRIGVGASAARIDMAEAELARLKEELKGDDE